MYLQELLLLPPVLEMVVVAAVAPATKTAIRGCLRLADTGGGGSKGCRIRHRGRGNRSTVPVISRKMRGGGGGGIRAGKRGGSVVGGRG